MIERLTLISGTPPATALMDALRAEGVDVQVRERIDTPATWEVFPQVLVIDGMPEAVNTECRIARQSPLLDETPILAVTPNDSAARLLALQHGADDCLAQPLDWVELLLRLRRLHWQNNQQIIGEDWLGIANILSHDLKSPLGTVVSSLELLTELLPDDSVRPLIQNSLLSSRRQSELIDNFLDYLRIHHHAFPVQNEALDLNTLLGELRPHFEMLSEQKQVRLLWECSPSLAPVIADKVLLLRVLSALFENNLRFCVRGNTLTIQTQEDTLGGLVRMLDTGRPLHPDFDDAIFDLQFQWEARAVGSRTSVAMNLPFIRAATRLMGGDIAAFSHDDVTVFTLRLDKAL